MGHFGRKKIFTDVTEITRDNVLEVLRKALITHWSNKADMEYLYAYYKGRQPVLNRKKEVRPEIKNTVVENRANEIVSFKVGYLMGEPIQYVSRSDNKSVADKITTLNGYCLSEDKAARIRNWRIGSTSAAQHTAWCFLTACLRRKAMKLLSRFTLSTLGLLSWCMPIPSVNRP